VLTSAACMEFMVEVTGLRPASRWLEYDGTSGKMRVDTTAPQKSGDLTVTRSDQGMSNTWTVPSAQIPGNKIVAQ